MGRMVGGVDRGGVLIVRVWKEDTEASPVRVRVTTARDDTRVGGESAVVGSVDEAVEVVREFLDRYLASTP